MDILKSVAGVFSVVIALAAPVTPVQPVSIAQGVSAEVPLAALHATTTLEAKQPVRIKPAVATLNQDALDLWLNKLIQVESNGRSDIKILDVNGKYSYGCLQFQMATFLNYADRYDMSVTRDDIYDCSIQKVLARKMILEHYTAWHNWENSVLYKVGVPPVV